ncbi:MAG: hypothetical protein LC649_02250 [Bacteroidales bacterium]|nr:hypothetical protein [Bacteroidales bacterium]
MNMNLVQLFKALSWLGFFAALTLSWIYYLKARNKERMALIEKGTDPSKIYSLPAGGKGFPWLKIGIVVVGICVGLLMGTTLYLLFPDQVGKLGPFLLFVLGFLFGGIGMIIANYMEKPERRQDG